MHAEGYFEYVETSRYKRVTLPYADSQYAMSVFLPAEDLSVAEFVRSFEPRMLTEKPQRTERQRMSIFPREIGVVMPKFEFLSASVLPDALKKLGLQSIFDQRLADLSGTSVDGDLFVSDILQSAALGVDEAGTTAAAGTVVVEHTRSAGPQEEIVFSRPFVCVIHNQAGEIVFIAQIERP